MVADIASARAGGPSSVFARPGSYASLAMVINPPTDPPFDGVDRDCDGAD